MPKGVVRLTPREALPIWLVSLGASPSIFFDPPQDNSAPQRRVPWMSACWRFHAEAGGTPCLKARRLMEASAPLVLLSTLLQPLGFCHSCGANRRPSIISILQLTLR